MSTFSQTKYRVLFFFEYFGLVFGTGPFYQIYCRFRRELLWHLGFLKGIYFQNVCFQTTTFLSKCIFARERSLRTTRDIDRIFRKSLLETLNSVITEWRNAFSDLTRRENDETISFLTQFLLRSIGFRYFALRQPVITSNSGCQYKKW